MTSEQIKIFTEFFKTLDNKVEELTKELRSSLEALKADTKRIESKLDELKEIIPNAETVTEDVHELKLDIGRLRDEGVM